MFQCRPKPFSSLIRVNLSDGYVRLQHELSSHTVSLANMRFPILLHDYFLQSAVKMPEKEALVCGADRLTYRRLDEASAALANTLIGMGVRRGDRVVIFMDTAPEQVIALLGTLKALGCFILLNGSIKARKLAYILKDSGARVLITHVNKRKVIKETRGLKDHTLQLVWAGDSVCTPIDAGYVSTTWDDALLSGSQHARSSTALDPESYGRGEGLDCDLAALIYTSGSTGEPKGVMSSHRNIISAAQSIVRYLGNQETDIILNALPLSFDYGLYQIIMAWMFGGTVILEKSFAFLHKILQRIPEEKVTGLPVVPTMVAMLLKMQDLTKYDVRTLRYLTNTGAAVPPEHILQIRKLFPNVRFYSMFGLTECKRVCYMPPAELDARPSSVGKAMPNCEVFVCDEQGKVVNPGEVGELVVRGSNVMKGYWKSPELTARTFRSGFFPGETLLYTGDLFRQDDEGYLYFLGRKDDMIKSRGERISPKEIENVVAELSDVQEVAVVGVPDDVLGQLIRCYVVAAPGAKLSREGVLKHCNDNLESFQVPQEIKFVDTLPKTAHGKIDKKLLSQS